MKLSRPLTRGPRVRYTVRSAMPEWDGFLSRVRRPNRIVRGWSVPRITHVPLSAVLGQRGRTERQGGAIDAGSYLRMSDHTNGDLARLTSIRSQQIPIKLALRQGPAPAREDRSTAVAAVHTQRVNAEVERADRGQPITSPTCLRPPGATTMSQVV